MEKIPIRPAARPSSPSRLSSYSLSFVSRAPTQKSRPRPISQSDAGRVASSAIVLPIEISAGQSGIGSTPLPNCVPLLNINPPRGNEEIRGAMLCFDWQASYMCSFDNPRGREGTLLGLCSGICSTFETILPLQDLSRLQNGCEISLSSAL